MHANRPSNRRGGGGGNGSGRGGGGNPSWIKLGLRCFMAVIVLTLLWRVTQFTTRRGLIGSHVGGGGGGESQHQHQQLADQKVNTDKKAHKKSTGASGAGAAAAAAAVGDAGKAVVAPSDASLSSPVNTNRVVRHRFVPNVGVIVVNEAEDDGEDAKGADRKEGGPSPNPRGAAALLPPARVELPFCSPEVARPFLVALNNKIDDGNNNNNNNAHQRNNVHNRRGHDKYPHLLGGSGGANGNGAQLPLHKSTVVASRVVAGVMGVVGPVAGTSSMMGEKDVRVVIEGSASKARLMLHYHNHDENSNNNKKHKNSKKEEKGNGAAAYDDSNGNIVFGEEPLGPTGALEGGWHCVSVVKMSSSSSGGDIPPPAAADDIILPVGGDDPINDKDNINHKQLHQEDDDPANKAIAEKEKREGEGAGEGELRRRAHRSAADASASSVPVPVPECIIAQKPFVSVDSGAHKSSELGVTPHKLTPTHHTPINFYPSSPSPYGDDTTNNNQHDTINANPNNGEEKNNINTMAGGGSTVNEAVPNEEAARRINRRQLLGLIPRARIEGVPAVAAIIHMPRELLLLSSTAATASADHHQQAAAGGGGGGWGFFGGGGGKSADSGDGDGANGNSGGGPIQYFSASPSHHSIASASAVLRGPFVEELLYNSPSDEEDEEVVMLNDPHYDPNDLHVPRRRRQHTAGSSNKRNADSADGKDSRGEEEGEGADGELLDEVGIRSLLSQYHRSSFQSLRVAAGRASSSSSSSSAKYSSSTPIPLYDGRGTFWITASSAPRSSSSHKAEGDADDAAAPPLHNKGNHNHGDEGGMAVDGDGVLSTVRPSHKRHLYTRKRHVAHVGAVEGLLQRRGKAKGKDGRGSSEEGALTSIAMQHIRTAGSEDGLRAVLKELGMLEEEEEEAESSNPPRHHRRQDANGHDLPMVAIHVTATIRITRHMSIIASGLCATIAFSRDAQLIVEPGVVLRMMGGPTATADTTSVEGKSSSSSSFTPLIMADHAVVTPLSLTAMSVASGWGGIVLEPAAHCYLGYVIISFTGSNGVRRVAGTGTHMKLSPAIAASPLTADAHAKLAHKQRQVAAAVGGADGPAAAATARTAVGDGQADDGGDENGDADGDDVQMMDGVPIMKLARDLGVPTADASNGDKAAAVLLRPADDGFDLSAPFGQLLAHIGRSKSDKINAMKKKKKLGTATTPSAATSVSREIASLYPLRTTLHLKHSAVVNAYGPAMGLGKGSHTVVTNTAVQDVGQGLECVECSLWVDGTTFTDFPFVSDKFKFVDEDNDGIYVRGGQATINNTIIGNALDDGIDSACNKNDPETSRITIENTHIFNCQHEGIAISGSVGANRFMRVAHSFVERCQQGIENGHSPSTHFATVYKTILYNNQVGMRFGDDYPLEVLGSITGEKNVFVDNVVPYLDYVKKEHKDTHGNHYNHNGDGGGGGGFNNNDGSGGGSAVFLWSNPQVAEAGLSSTFMLHGMGVCHDCRVIHPLPLAAAVGGTGAAASNVFLYLSQFASDGFVCGSKALGGRHAV